MGHNHTTLLHQIALTMLPGVGGTVAKNLVAYCGSAEAVFTTPKSKLTKIPLIADDRATRIVSNSADVLSQAEKELRFVLDNNIQVLFFTDEAYPERLKHCADSPALLYYKGNTPLNTQKVIAIVGTRRATDYGKEATRKLVADLSAHQPLILSGLAYGIDIAAHQAALENGLPTVGVLGHGLQKIYPPQHSTAAKKMVEQGGLLTEYNSHDDMLPQNFPERNRIVAGMCDAIVVVESAPDGGAVITANIAHSYNRDVFAYAGRSIDKASTGCNYLIKSNKAALIDNATDLIEAMRWELNTPAPKPQRQLALTLSTEEQQIYSLLNEKGEAEIDLLTNATGMGSSALAGTLLEMEMNGLILSLPGKRYKLV